jgi:4-hydroxybutyrate CoA-transferase
MRIGIKYCGGCNPGYDRTALIKKIKDNVSSNHVFENFIEEVIYDVVIVLCGCTGCYRNYEYIHSKYGNIFASRENDYQKILNLLDEIDNEYCGG